MITILGSLIGFLTSHSGEMLRIWKDRNDKRHSVEVLEKQIELETIKNSQDIKLSELNAQSVETKAIYSHASLPASKWVDSLRSSVRPIVTYAFFILFVVVKVATLIVLMKNGANFFNGLVYLWDEGTQALFASVMVFWFGHRAIMKNREAA